MKSEVTILAEAILARLAPGKSIASTPLAGTPPNLRSLARAVSMELDPSASTSWIAAASPGTIRDYLQRGIPTATAPIKRSSSRPTPVTPPVASPAIDMAEVVRVVDARIKSATPATPAADPKTEEEIKALRARVDTLHGEILESIDTAKAVADEAARQAADAAKAVASAAVASASGIDPTEIKRMIEAAARAAVLAPVKSTPAAPTTPATAPAAPVRISDKDDAGAESGVTSATPEPTSAEDHVLAHLDLFASPGAAHKPVIIKGEAGAGKTYAARIHGRKFDKYVEIALHAETEAADLLGFNRVDGSWQDGPLTQAFRAAASGLRVLVVKDEFYRPRNQARGILMTCTSPFKDHAGRSFYPLTTGRAIPHPTEPDLYEPEVIYAPCHLLAIVGTTNVGSQYDVNPGDPAEKRRFAPVHIDVTADVLGRILSSVIHSKHPFYRSRDTVIAKCKAFWTACRELKKTDRIEIVPTASTFCEALEHPTVKTLADFRNVLAALGMHVWVGEDIEGRPIPEQIAGVEKALRDTLS